MNDPVSRRGALGALAGLAAVAVAGPGAVRAAAAGSPVLAGHWQAIDPDNGKPYALIEFIEGPESASGVVRGLYPQSGEPENPNCAARCPGAKSGQPVIGLEAVWGLKRRGSGPLWEGGQVLVPDDGTVLSCQIELDADGRALSFRFFKGLPIFGATERWRRADAAPAG